MAPDEAEKERASGGHDGDVRKMPVAVISWERVDDTKEEGMTRC